MTDAPLTISLASQKGGVGKSTLSRAIAARFAANGWHVKIADLDQGQGTSTLWGARRNRNGITPDVAVQQYRSVRDALRDRDAFDLFIFDGAPAASDATLAAAQVSDLVIIPTNAALDDLHPSVELAHQLVKRGIPAERIRFVFNHIATDAELAAARDYITRATYSAFTGSLPERAAYRAAADLGKAANETTFPTLNARVNEVIAEAKTYLDSLTEQTTAKGNAA
jgi:chromosome partitioning protein